MITTYKVTPQTTSQTPYFLLSYLMDGSWHQYDRPFKDREDAVRYGKSFVKSQSFNLTTTGGV